MLKFTKAFIVFMVLLSSIALCSCQNKGAKEKSAENKTQATQEEKEEREDAKEDSGKSKENSDGSKEDASLTEALIVEKNDEGHYIDNKIVFYADGNKLTDRILKATFTRTYTIEKNFNYEEHIRSLKSTFEENENLVKTLPGVKVAHKEEGDKFLEIFEIPLTNAEEWDSAMAHELFPDNTTIRADWDHPDSIELVDYDDLTVDYMIKHYKHYEWNIEKAPR